MREIDDVADEIAPSMRLLRRAMKGVPAESEGFKGAHDRLTREVALLVMSLEETASAMDSIR